VPEVVDDGVTGFIVDSEAEAVHAIERLRKLDRQLVRARFDERFTARRMAKEYVALYEKIARCEISGTRAPALRDAPADGFIPRSPSFSSTEDSTAGPGGDP
jgi:hypothetical protein